VGVRNRLIFQTVTAVAPLWTYMILVEFACDHGRGMSCSIETVVMLPSMIRGQENNDQKTGLQLKGGGGGYNF